MPPHSFWKGYLKLSLVTCPVSMMPATSEGERVRFRTLNARTGNPVISRYVDAVSGKPVSEDDEVKGYPRGETDYVVLEDDEIAAVALESARTIDIEKFVLSDSIGWIWYDKAHYLTPESGVGEDAFSVIRDAMLATGTVGISRLVLYRRERAVVLKPSGRGIILWTLRYGDEVRNAEDYFGHIGKGEVDTAHLRLVRRVIDGMTVPWDPAMAHDPVQEKLLDIIAAKKKGRKKPVGTKARPAGEPRNNVVSILDALKRSIAADTRGKPE